MIHTVTTEALTPVAKGWEYVAKCECGWRSEPSTSHNAAEMGGRQHLLDIICRFWVSSVSVDDGR